MQSEFTIAENTLDQLDEIVLSDSSLLRQNPSLQLAMQEIAVAEAAKNVQKAELKPEFTGGYFIQSLTGNQEVNNQTVYYKGIPRFQGITLGIALPIFGKAGKSGKIRRCKYLCVVARRMSRPKRQTCKGFFRKKSSKLKP